MNTQIPLLGTMRVGSWGANFKPRELADYLLAARELGIEMLDLADIYGDHQTNALIGAAFALEPALKQFQLIFKAGILMAQSPGNSVGLQYYNNSPSHLQLALDQVLAQLQVDCIDQFLLHRVDLLWQTDAIARWAESQIKAGKIKRFGLSNANVYQLDAMQSHIALVSNQIELSLAERGALLDVLPWCTKHHTVVQAYSPLIRADSALATSEPFRLTCEQYAAQFELSIEGLWQRWVASIPGVQLITGTAKLDRLQQAVLAAKQCLPRDVWYALLSAAQGKGMA